ncbi:MAG: hypothetical protein JRE16_05310 [Deltaproteobacteria bacterium]|jgi:hypothetical protein|nr:hypothetical protein [Deltaproteobacteria bacterium]
MRQLVKAVFVALLVIMFSIFSPITSISSDVLDGKQFVAKVDGDQDILTFKNGTFHSSSCDEYGFGPGEYSTQNTERGIAFEATTSSENHGQMVWTGTVEGDSIEGSYHWAKKGWLGTKEKTKAFTGTMNK